MASINVTEIDFSLVATAAFDARDAGRDEAAHGLDKLARKINAALSNARVSRSPFGKPTKSLTWRDVPSVFKPLEG
jgi:hypothetical protein